MSLAPRLREFEMQHFTLALSLSVVLGAVPGADTVQRPAFTGRWIQESPTPASAGVGPICSMGCVMALDAATLTVTGHDGANPRVFPLDGSPRTAVFGMGGFAAESTTMAHWEGHAIVITRLQGKKVFSTTRLSIRDGRLIISATGRGRGGNGTTFVYRRAR
jgi:hypothetical protein